MRQALSALSVHRSSGARLCHRLVYNSGVSRPWLWVGSVSSASHYCDAASAQSQQPNKFPTKKHLKQLKAEAVRQIMRTHKKVVKAHNNANTDVEALQAQLSMLNGIEAALDTKPMAADVERIAEQLGMLPNIIKDDMPTKQEPKVERGPRLPYKIYTSSEGIQIHVGKQAEDNDELSTSNKHRHKSEWWLHASGCPGSHVVVKCSDDHPPTEAVLDAAALAARHSKFARARTVKVSLTRCRDVSKRKGAPAGQVVLTGSIKEISVNMHAEKERLLRLDSTRNS